GGMK
ncbi:hypothetical protein EC52239_1105, partial [Escherichia coli 5.2239]